jgi:hypothetical protein
VGIVEVSARDVAAVLPGRKAALYLSDRAGEVDHTSIKAGTKKHPGGRARPKKQVRCIDRRGRMKNCKR